MLFSKASACVEPPRSLDVRPIGDRDDATDVRVPLDVNDAMTGVPTFNPPKKFAHRETYIFLLLCAAQVKVDMNKLLSRRVDETLLFHLSPSNVWGIPSGTGTSSGSYPLVTRPPTCTSRKLRNLPPPPSVSPPESLTLDLLGFCYPFGLWGALLLQMPYSVHL
jgi:hypothetical protein